MKHSLLWLRNDLRDTDNPALSRALQRGGRVSALYIDCPEQWEKHALGRRQLDFIRLHLDEIEEKLTGKGISLHRLQCDSFEQVPTLLNEFIAREECDALFANQEIGFNEHSRDRQVVEKCSIPFELTESDCIIQPGKIQTQSEQMFKVFTPFRNAWMKYLTRYGYVLHDGETAKLADALKKRSAQTYCGWGIGAQSAQQRLDRFCQNGLQGYSNNRDFPILDATSGLSPYLAIGVLSPRQCLAAIESTLGYLPLSSGETGFSWLNELVWRDFYRHLMFSFKDLSKGNPFKAETRNIEWSQSEKRFQLWCSGNTGFPIIDAAMRCLNETGWMHNRLRMIVASFLVKDCHINWQWGERYFMQQLIDADFPSNNGGWQWSAGTGADAAPYFRIFNPTTQSQKFDQQGQFIRRWVPELKLVPDKHIHAPHNWLSDNQNGTSYAQPMVVHKDARAITLTLYKQAKARG